MRPSPDIRLKTTSRSRSHGLASHSQSFANPLFRPRPATRPESDADRQRIKLGTGDKAGRVPYSDLASIAQEGRVACEEMSATTPGYIELQLSMHNLSSSCKMPCNCVADSRRPFNPGREFGCNPTEQDSIMAVIWLDPAMQAAGIP